jgi:hypothetical protein
MNLEKLATCEHNRQNQKYEDKSFRILPSTPDGWDARK